MEQPSCAPLQQSDTSSPSDVNNWFFITLSGVCSKLSTSRVSRPAPRVVSGPRNISIKASDLDRLTRDELDSWDEDMGPPTPLLDTVNFPIHLKNMKMEELRQLTKEIRADLIHKVRRGRAFRWGPENNIRLYFSSARVFPQCGVRFLFMSVLFIVFSHIFALLIYFRAGWAETSRDVPRRAVTTRDTTSLVRYLRTRLVTRDCPFMIFLLCELIY